MGRVLSDKNLDMVSIQDRSLHLQRRQAWTRVLSSKALKEYEENMALRVGQLVGRLAETEGEVLIDEWFNCFT